MVALTTRNSDVRYATREYYAGFVTAVENAFNNEKKKNFLRTQVDAR